MRVWSSFAVIAFAAVGCAERHSPSEVTDPRCETKGSAVWDSAESGPASGDLPSPEPAAPLGGICDGSSELRLVVATRYNHALQTYVWAFEFGGELLAVDGRCHYYAAYDPRQGVMEGQLSADQLDALTRDLAVNELEQLPSTQFDCADHYLDRLIATKDASLRCRCDDCAISEKSTAAIQNAVEWIELLATQGRPFEGSVRALGIQREPPEHEPPLRTQEVLAWPLSRSLEDFPGLLEMGGNPRGVLFPPPAAAKLRELRRGVGEMRLIDDLTYSSIYVHDCTDTYELLMHDALPEELSDQLAELLPSAWARPQIQSCTRSANNAMSLQCPPID